MRQEKIIHFLALAFWLFSGTLFAQIVNIEDKRLALDTSGIAGRIDVSGNLTRNSREVLNLSSGLRLDWQREHSHWLLLGNYSLVRANSDRFLNRGFGHLRYGRQLRKRWYWESFGQLQYNEQLRIKLRALLGTGPRFQIAEAESWTLAAGTLYMYEYNEWNDGETLRRDHRLSTYLSLKYKQDNNWSFSSTSYYQPLLTKFGESRLSTVNTFQLQIRQGLSLTSIFSLTYDGLLAANTENVPATTYQWRNGLRFSF